ncbi:MAG: DUF4135 domain-containing protein [Candidatus Algichlamydia australiensis]|nr:DUF4135 domain-containing protein [Chlamydiales bacterium]
MAIPPIQFTFEMGLKDDYLAEVKGHIIADQNRLINLYSNQHDRIETIEIEKAGEETHFKGKVALFLKITTFQNKTIRLVYKPRKLDPEKHLEDCIEELTGRSKRRMLLCDTYGYDFFIEGTSLKGLSGKLLCKRLIELCELNDINKKTISILHKIGFEDTHGENFIVTEDNNLYLYFIDAEVYQTKTSVNIESVYQELEEQGCFAQEDENTKERIEHYRNLVKTTPTRLILCNTQTYQLFYITKKFNKPFNFKNLSVKEVLIQGGSTLLEHHTARLAQFLYINGFIELENGMSFSEISKVVSNSFEDENAIDLIEKELDASREVKSDVPVFYFHLIDCLVECPITGRKLPLKKREETSDAN